MSIKEELNPYSLKVFEYLEKHHSNLLDKITTQPCDFGKKYLEVIIPKLNNGATYGLCFNSEDETLTLGFDNYHCHIHQFYEQKFEVEIIRSMEMFTKILDDELFVLRAGGITSLIEKKDISSLRGGVYKYGKEFNLKSLKIISWTGKYDETVEYTHIEKSTSFFNKIKSFILNNKDIN